MEATGIEPGQGSCHPAPGRPRQRSRLVSLGLLAVAFLEFFRDSGLTSHAARGRVVIAGLVRRLVTLRLFAPEVAAVVTVPGRGMRLAPTGFPVERLETAH